MLSNINQIPARFGVTCDVQLLFISGTIIFLFLKQLVELCNINNETICHVYDLMRLCVEGDF